MGVTVHPHLDDDEAQALVGLTIGGLTVVKALGLDPSGTRRRSYLCHRLADNMNTMINEGDLLALAANDVDV